MKNYIWWFKFNLALFQIALVVLKLVKILDWSWWWVMSPWLAAFVVEASLAFAKGFADGVRK